MPCAFCGCKIRDGTALDSIEKIWYKENDRYVTITLGVDVIEITDIDKFLSELNEPIFYKYVFGDPETVYSDRAVYILYSNGDREFIHHQAQNCINSGEVIYRRLTCDMSSFDDFIRACIETAKD